MWFYWFLVFEFYAFSNDIRDIDEVAMVSAMIYLFLVNFRGQIFYSIYFNN